MNKKNIIKQVFVAALTLCAFAACDDKLDYELFEKHVLLTKNGWIEQTVDISDENTVEIPFAVSVNGTTDNDRTIAVDMAFDPDNLKKYNFDKFRLQESLYYSALPEDAVSFKEQRVTIPSGDIRGVSSLVLDLNKVTDRYADYVLPIKIDTVSEYFAATSYRQAMYHLVLQNRFSGNYAGDLKVYKTTRTITGPAGARDTTFSLNESAKNDAIEVATKTLYAVSANTCYFYVAHYSASELERSKYIVNITVDDEGNVTVDSPNPDLKISTKGQQQMLLYTMVKEDTSDKRYNRVTYSLLLSYLATLPNLDANFPVLIQGTITMERAVLK